MTMTMKDLTFLVSLVLLAPLLATAATDDPTPAVQSPTDITILRKPGHEDGKAQMKVKNKLQTITSHAVQAWPVRQGQGALILIVEQKGSHPRQYSLRYYELDSGRRRILGAVPFNAATLQESPPTAQEWAFALTGSDPATSQPLTLVGGAEAMPGILPGASSPVFTDDTLTYTSLPGGEKHTVKTAALLGTNLRDIYSPPQSSIVSLQYLQVFPNGAAMTISNDNAIHKGQWQTDGSTLSVNVEGANLSIPQASLQPIKGVPAGTRFSVRLIEPVSSRSTKEGMTVHAVSITPIIIDADILIPAGSYIEGIVTKANSVGWGFKHETASLTIDWNLATLADGRKLPITAHIFEVENSQEKVTANGKIQGIRSTGTPGHSVENGVLTFAGIDPIAYIFAAAAGSAVLGFAEPEILYNAGTELILEYTRPLITAQSYPPSILPFATSDVDRERLQTFVHTIPFRTRTKGTNKVSDLTNLIFFGSPDALHRAFTAAGWLPSDDLNSTSTFRTLKTLSGNQTYTQAPMSVLLLDERAPLFTLGKTTNTFSARHHIRVFPTDDKWDGATVLTASSTQDIGIAFSRKQKTFIHVIDQHIDNERSKVINDLRFTGCVSSIDMVPRPWLPTDAFNSTGDRLLTDRDVAVLHITSCDNPRTTPETIPPIPNRTQRIVRDTALTIRNDFYRGNLIYQGISGGFAVKNYLRSSNELPQDYGSWRKTDASGAKYNLVGTSQPVLRHRSERSALQTSPEDLAAMQKIKESHKWDPPRYEFALEGGYLHFREFYLSDVDIFLTSETNPTFYEVDLYDQVNDGWAAGGTVTVNSWKHLSNEFSYFRQQGKYTISVGVYVQDPLDPNGSGNDEDSAVASSRVGLTTREFEYNLLGQLRPPTSRWRPYIAIGPAFQLISLSSSPLKKPAGPFTLGLKNIGLIKAAFDFGNTPPLDGGGIFQFGLQYGAGIKYRLSPRVMLRSDYRETWSKNPNIIKNSYQDFEYDTDGSYTTTIDITKPQQKFFQDRFTLGVAFAF